MAAQPDASTLDFIFEQARDVPENQLRSAEALDAKVVQVFAAASVVLGLGAAGGLTTGGAASGPVIAAAVAYATVVVASFLALRVRSFRTIASPDKLWHSYWQEPVADIKHTLIADLATSYTENDTKLRSKSRAFNVVLFATGIEALLVTVALLTTLA